MDYKPRSNYNNKSSLTYKKKRCFWFNSEFNEDFIINNGKIYEIIFKVPPFQIYKNNKMKVITYIRGSQNSRPIIIKMKEPFLSYQTIFNSDNEAYPTIYINHTGVESMTSITPYYSLIPQQIPRFIFRFDDNFNKLDFTSYFTSITNGSLFQVAGGGNDYKYITFNSSGSFVLDKNLTCDILVVGGGGGGGGALGGGGGGGAVLYITNLTIPTNTYSITVGSGGAGGTGSENSTSVGTNGGNSSITIGGTTYTAVGGGGGAYRDLSSIGTNGINGGSGGGGSHTNGPTRTLGGSSIKNTYSGWTSLGNSGSRGISFDSTINPNNKHLGGAGGGAGSSGYDAYLSADKNTGFAGNGGDGINLSSIFGTSVGHNGWFSGGGGGSIYSGDANTNAGFANGGNGLFGGGGNGSGGNGNNGINNTGGGGGAAGHRNTGGNGGSGVVIIRFRETRQEGLTPDETIITSTNNSLTIPVNSKYNINYGDYFNIPKGSYQAVFSDGSITLNSITDKSYPILKDANNNNINPLVWYKFDDGALLTDSGTSGFTLTNNSVIINTTIFSRGNASANFNSTGWFSVSTSLFNNLTNYTISFWLFLNALGSYIITSKQHDGFNSYAILGIGAYSDSGGVFGSGTSGKIYYHPKNSINNAESTSTLNINNWNFITIVATSSNCLIYINGSLDSTTNGDYSLPNATSVTNSLIGSWRNSSGLASASINLINGNMDDFRVYNIALTQAQITELYNGRLSIYNPPEFILGVEIKDA